MIVVVAVVLILVVLILAFFFTRRTKRNCVVFYGPSGGKTSLFYRLKTGKFVSTVASMKENDGTFAWAGQDSDKQPRHTVDIPSNGRLRWRLKDFLPVAEAIVVVLDSTS